MKSVIINADDLGICCATNTAIGLAFRDGIVTSASLMVNMPAFADALDRVVCKHEHLGVGLHLVLTSGRPVLDPSRVPLLVDARGHFAHGFAGLARLLLSRHRRAVLRQIRAEWRAQFEKARAAGITLDHVDSHQHVHMLPPLWTSARRLASDYAAGPVRDSHERVTFLGPIRWHPRDCLRPLNVAKVVTLSRYARTNADRERTRGQRPDGFLAPRRLIGVRHSGRIDHRVLTRLFASLPDGITEVVTHPGTSIDGPAQETLSALSRADQRFLQSPNRRLELRTLLDDALKRLLESERIQLLSHRDAWRPAPATRSSVRPMVLVGDSGSGPHD
jgi:chitin disaccharide deacetylase